jgi:hypothetical protein
LIVWVPTTWPEASLRLATTDSDVLPDGKFTKYVNEPVPPLPEPPEPPPPQPRNKRLRPEIAVSRANVRNTEFIGGLASKTFRESYLFA